MGCRLKAGSLTPEGRLVGKYPVWGDWRQEPVVVPRDYGATLRHLLGRCEALRKAGWVMCPAALMHRIPERDEFILIHRDSQRYRQFLQAPAHRRRHGAAS